MVYKKTNERWYKEWQRVLQRQTMSDKQWQRFTIPANFSFYQKKRNSSTKHAMENPLNIEQNLLNEEQKEASKKKY